MAAFGSGFDPVAFDAGAAQQGWNLVGSVSLHLTLTLSRIPADIFNGSNPPAAGGVIPAAPGYSGRTAAVWRPVVRLGGVDVSGQVLGEIVVTAAEGAARIAEFSVLPDPGQVISLPSWTGLDVTIDFAVLAVDGTAMYPQRLFTGVVNKPSFNEATSVMSVMATDDLQGVVSSWNDAEIDAFVQARWSHVVFDAARSVGWQRVQDRMSTRCASLDLTPYRMPRVSEWIYGVQHVITVTADDYEDDSLVPESADRAGLVNYVEIEFGYRYPLLNSAGYPASYTLVPAGMSWRAFINQGNMILTRSAVESALSSAGATIVSISYEPIPKAYAESDWIWDPGPASVSSLLCQGFTAVCSLDYANTSEEQHKIWVTAPVSIAQAGIRKHKLSGALEGKYPDPETWENQTWLFKSKQNKAVEPEDVLTPKAAFVVKQEATLTPDTDRSAADEAMATLIDMAKVVIQESHRRGAVSVTVPLNPVIDLDKWLHIVGERVEARGKVRSLSHRMDTDSGRAVTDVEIAISGSAGVGISHPETDTVAPEGSEVKDKVLDVHILCSFNYGYEEDHVFSVEMPGVDEKERGRQLEEIESEYFALLAEDLFIVRT